MRIYALRSPHEKFGVWIKDVPKSIQGEIPVRARRKERLRRSKLKQAFLIDSDAELYMFKFTKFNVLGSAHEKYGVWNGPYHSPPLS